MAEKSQKKEEKIAIMQAPEDPSKIGKCTKCIRATCFMNKMGKNLFPQLKVLFILI